MASLCLPAPNPQRWECLHRLRQSQLGWTSRAELACGDACQVEALCKEGRLDLALLCLEQSSTVPSPRMYKILLQACTRTRGLAEAKLVHAHLEHHGFESNGFLGDFVVTTFISCGSLADGLEVFRRLSDRTVGSWTAIISGYCNAGQFRQALVCYEQMQQDGVLPSSYTLVSLLKACSRLEDLEEGKRIHAASVKHGFDSNPFVANSLIRMYSKCGSMDNARHVFDGLSHRDLVSWNVMLAAYSQVQQADLALQIYDRMRHEEVIPDSWTFVSALLACGTLAEKEKSEVLDGKHLKVESLQRGKQIHAHASSVGLVSDVFVGSTLVSMYAKCGTFEHAQFVFDSLPQHNMVVCNAMLAACVQHDEGEKALQIYALLHDKGFVPDSRTFVSILQSCSFLAGKEEMLTLDGQSIKVELLRKGKQIHAEANERGFASHMFLASALVHMYSKCGSIIDAQQVFDGLAQRDVVIWNSLLAAYVLHAQGDRVMQICTEMREEKVTLNARTFVSALQACSILSEQEAVAPVDGQFVKLESLLKGKELHAEAAGMGFDSDMFVAINLVSMYSKCGNVKDARLVFDKLSHRDVMAWNAMLAGYVEQNQGERGLEIYEEMRREGVRPDAQTFVSVLQACSSIEEKEEIKILENQPVKVVLLQKGKEIHAEAAGMRLQSNMFLSNTLLSLYARCGSIKDAQHLFHGLPQYNVVSWTVMLAACVHWDQGDKGLQIYRLMQDIGVRPCSRTFVSALQACIAVAEAEKSTLVNGTRVKVKALRKGKEIHSEAVLMGAELDMFVGSTLVCMYARCGCILDARHAFDSLLQRDIVAWTAMIAAYAQQDQGEEGLRIYQQMQEENVRPTAQTFVSAFHACGSASEEEVSFLVDGQNVKVKSLRTGKQIHADAAENGLSADVVVSNTLISMYSNCGSLKDAEQVFEQMPKRDVVSWTAMITAFALHDQGKMGLHLFSQMQAEDVELDEAAILSVLDICSDTGALDICVHIHRSIAEIECSSSVANSLIHAYGKCGSMVDAQSVFDTLPRPDVVSWNTLIGGYARAGYYETSTKCYEQMCRAGVEPDSVTFVAVLSACSHAGMVDDGLEYFERMTRHYGVCPELEHYLCVMDLLGRAGLFSKTQELLRTMPMQPDFSLWLCLLGACQKHGNIQLGKQAFDGAIDLDSRQAAPYVLMSNIYASAGLWRQAREIHALRQNAGAWKKPGQTWIEHEHRMHVFLVGNPRHQNEAPLYRLLNELRTQLN